MTTTIIQVSAVLFVLISMSCKWLGARGKLKAMYTLWLVLGCLMMSYNLALSTRPEQGICLVMLVPCAWTVFSGVVGLRRLAKENRP